MEKKTPYIKAIEYLLNPKPWYVRAGRHVAGAAKIVQGLAILLFLLVLGGLLFTFSAKHRAGIRKAIEQKRKEARDAAVLHDSQDAHD